MATAGVESLEIWTLNDDLQYDESTCKHFKIDASSKESGVIKVKITGLGAEDNVTYASNVPKLTTHGSPSPKAEVELLDLPLEAQAALLGVEYKNGTIKVTSDYNSPYVAIELVGNHIGAGNHKDHIAFPRATVALGDQEMDTREEKAADPKTDSVTFSALADNNGVMYAKGFDGESGWSYETFKSEFLSTASKQTLEKSKTK